MRLRKQTLKQVANTDIAPLSICMMETGIRFNPYVMMVLAMRSNMAGTATMQYSCHFYGGSFMSATSSMSPWVFAMASFLDLELL